MWPKQHSGVNKSTWPLTLCSRFFQGEVGLVRQSGAKRSQSPSATLPLWGCHVTPPSHGSAHQRMYHKVHPSIEICFALSLSVTFTRMNNISNYTPQPLIHPLYITYSYTSQSWNIFFVEGWKWRHKSFKWLTLILNSGKEQLELLLEWEYRFFDTVCRLGCKTKDE